MFRSRTTSADMDGGFPHTRGDVPCVVIPTTVQAAFSPHAWGCSAQRVPERGRPLVFPTRVGMFRAHPRGEGRSRGFPHTRGDVPTTLESTRATRAFSPHAWGCSEHRQPRRHRDGVFPTRVGMFRAPAHGVRQQVRFPHTRGDVPSGLHYESAPGMFSPHAWGCSGDQVV